MLAVAVASEALLAKLDTNKADLAKLADPRTIKLDDAVADEIAKRAAPVYYITGRDPRQRGRGADRADGAGLPARGGRQPLHPQHPRARHHAHHAGRRTRRPRHDGGRLRVEEEAPERHAAGRDLLGEVRRARQQPRRDGADAQAVAERAEHLHRVEGAGAARPARVGLVPLRQHRRQRPVQRVARPDPDQRVAPDRVEQRERDDPDGHAGRLRVGHVRHVVARLPDVLRGAAQRRQPALRDVRQRRQRRHRGADAVGERDGAHLVPAEPADRPGALVAAQQQQLRADRPDRLAQLLREQPRLLPAQLLREEQAVGDEAEGRGAGGVRAAGERPAAGRAGRTAARAAEAGRGDLAGDGGVHGDACRRGRRRAGSAADRGAVRLRRPAAGGQDGQPPASARQAQRRRRSRHRDPRVPGGQLHRADGSAVLAHRRRAARLPVLGAERRAVAAVRRHRVDVPRGLRRPGRCA